MFSDFISVCSIYNEDKIPKSWPKESALKWAATFLQCGSTEGMFDLWRIIVSSKYILEIYGSSDRAVRIATHCRQIDELTGISIRSTASLTDEY